MPRGKSIVKLLLDSSKAALFAGIEIHNKPHVSYRYPTATILVVNAWELLLKAYVYKYIGKKRIYEKDMKHTISFSKALALTQDHVNQSKKNARYRAVFENIDLLNEYRCSNVHYVEAKLDPIIFTLLGKAVLNYDMFLKDFFNKDITSDDNLVILPIGFKLPFDPIDYLLQDYDGASNEFVNKVIETIRKLDQEKIPDSIVIGIDVYTTSVKKVDNADIIAAIDQKNGQIALVKTFRPTDDPNAPEMRIPEDFVPPLTYTNVREEVRKRRPDIKFNGIYNEVMKEVKSNAVYCRPRYLDPKMKKGTKKDFYMEDSVDEVIRLYDLKVAEDTDREAKPVN